MMTLRSCALVRALSLAALLSGVPTIGFAQPQPPQEATPQPPAIRRWLDVQHLQISTRFRWIESTEGVVSSSSIQWQPQLRARFLIDRDAKYAIHVGAFSGRSFASGWNNTGAGLGRFGGEFNVKQLFLAVTPTPGLEIQAGGLYMLRGENTEITSYDNDAYIMGERVSWQPRESRVTEVALTTGYIGDRSTPNVFERTERIGQWNYGQALVGWRMSEHLTASADYTYEDGRDIIRQGFTLRLPESVPLLTTVKVDAYERISPSAKAGFDAAANLQPLAPLRVTVGVESIDSRYGPVNADRYLTGTHFYTQGNYALTPDVSIGWFQEEAFAVHRSLANQRRLELIVTLNPTRTFKAHRIF